MIRLATNYAITTSARSSIAVVLLALLTLVSMLVLMLVLMVPAEAGAQEHRYEGALKCKRCHEKAAIGDQYASWGETKHAKAFETLATDQAKKWAAEAGVDDPQVDERCVKCHSTAYGVSEKMLSRKFNHQAGVQCEACHGPGKDYRKKKIMVDRELAVSKGLILQTEKVCLACHNDESPAWDPARYTLASGKKVGFDYEQAVRAIAHPVPEGYDALAEGGAD